MNQSNKLQLTPEEIDKEFLIILQESILIKKRDFLSRTTTPRETKLSFFAIFHTAFEGSEITFETYNQAIPADKNIIIKTLMPLVIGLEVSCSMMRSEVDFWRYEELKAALRKVITTKELHNNPTLETLKNHFPHLYQEQSL